MNLSNRKIGMLMTSTSLLPFIGGMVYHLTPAGNLSGGPDLGICPLREYLGIPCALCGASRTFSLLMHHDSSWLLYNPWWVVVFIATFFIGVLFLTPSSATPLREFFKAQSSQAWLSYFMIIVFTGWITALINFSHVVPFK